MNYLEKLASKRMNVRIINCVNVSQAITEVLTVAALFGQHWKEVGLPHPIPIACVGCGDADRVRES
jgi:hypothetical protein